MSNRMLLLAVWLCWVESYFFTHAIMDDAQVYDVKIEGNTVAKIQTKTRFLLDNEEIVLPNNANATGRREDPSFFVDFNWEADKKFQMHFKEAENIAYLVEASLSTKDANIDWNLGFNLRDSNASYTCSALFSVANKSQGYAKLVMRRNRFQVFHFDKDFSSPVACPEDGQDMVPGEWNLTTSDGIPCVRLEGAMAFNISYLTMERHNATAKINLPPTAVVLPEKSFCFSPDTTVNTTMEQTVVLGFYDNWNLTLHFTRDGNITKDNWDDHWIIDSVGLQFVYENEHFPSTLHPGTGKEEMKNKVGPHGEGSLNLFRTMKDRSYSCNALMETAVVNNFTLLTKSLHAQAFMYEPQYFPVESCAADLMTSDLVPIIIGAALAILIVIVLVAYLIGRARTRRQTYENI
uniref:L-type lectin-like domain-containing protein n=1 Tax=Trichuris muris TaxID=70415 RepID=A0A5S6QUE4_TRIMR